MTNRWTQNTCTHTYASYLNGQMQKQAAQNKLQQNELKMKQAWGKHSRPTKECVVIKTARTLPWSPLEGERYLQPLFRLSLGQRVNESLTRKNQPGSPGKEKFSLVLDPRILLRPWREGTAKEEKPLKQVSSEKKKTKKHGFLLLKIKHWRQWFSFIIVLK